MDQRAIGMFIARRRKEKHLTQLQLAEQLGVTNKSVSKWERGACLPDPSLYEPLCERLGITINELFAGRVLAREEYADIADANLLHLLKHHLYQTSDKSLSFAQFDHALMQMSKVIAMLMQFDTKEDAVDYLVSETNLPREECAAAYDYYRMMFRQWDV